MPKRRKSSSYPNPANLDRAVARAIADLQAIPAMYRRLHDMTGTAPRRESVHVNGGGDHDPTGELAMPVVVDEGLDPEQQKALRETETERRRKHARRVAADVARAGRIAAQVRDSLENHVGPTAGFRQPTRARGGWVSQEELAESLANQQERLAAGVE